jgi:DNA-directed RNA polymerase subunit H (RpoH/RPB5)
MSTSQNSSVLISSIYKSRKTILELMKRQDYNVEDYENFSISEVNSMTSNNQLDMLLEKKKEDDTTHRKSKIYIRYHLNKTIRPNTNLPEMIDDLFNLEQVLTSDDTLFIIAKDEVNETLMNEMKHIWEKDGIFIVVESIRRLQYNILNHSQVPFHRIMSELEVKSVMEKYNITDRNLFPEISRFDPVAKVICLRPGQVCHIIRPSKTAITADYYRICV